MKNLSILVVLIFSFGVFFVSCQDVNQPEDLSTQKVDLEKTAVAEKVHMLHNGKIIEVSTNAMDAHFAHGDRVIVFAGDLFQGTREEAWIDEKGRVSQKWFFYNDESAVDQIDNSLGTFVPGPGAPPFGTGSAEISVSGQERVCLATYQFSGTPLAEITTLAFSTYNPSFGSAYPNGSGYLNINVDFNGSDSWQRRLIFTPPSGTVVQDTWQEWDAYNGGNALWRYSGSTWPVTGGSGNTAKTWNQILTDYPGVRIRVTDSFVGIRVGSPYPLGYTENIDVFKFGTSFTKVFDFEN